MSSFGVLLGAGLLILVTVVAFLLGAQAARGVRRFREDHHQSFLGRKKP